VLNFLAAHANQVRAQTQKTQQTTTHADQRISWRDLTIDLPRQRPGGRASLGAFPPFNALGAALGLARARVAVVASGTRPAALTAAWAGAPDEDFSTGSNASQGLL
jgi:hypothetical protein